MEVNFNEFLISDDKNKLRIDCIFQLLSTSYWAKDRPREIVEKSLLNSMCFGIYINENQIGFARCVSDFATVYWLAHVIIDTNYRGLGLGKALVKAVVGHEQLKGCSGILKTSDAYGLYEKYGFN